ncbi:hypothetical protein G4Z02_04735 [Candidatus Xianfuyuplasma coldseepsis]|uniref:Glycoamylase-like domain-containing protein n=2 Tax=Candidatus Xianfuyuplasma coldseepsis TaxID=2782163 RepID=A0A7L7KTQ4_9MOLU|nr:hypothetical protein G4Z02_04735 [Xianfuyuplasma coldseepsis]
MLVGLAACRPQGLQCDEGYIEDNGVCVVDLAPCEDGLIEEDGQCVDAPLAAEEILLWELEKSFNMFWLLANTNEESDGYGLITSRYPTNGSIASIAGVGFGLAAIPIGVEMGFITYEEGQERALKTLQSMSELVRFHGFYYHFWDKASGTRYGSSEVSIIDTGLFLGGALTAGEYFGGDVKTVADDIYTGVDWTWYYNDTTNKFYMGYDRDEEQHFGSWNHVAEQLILYVLSAGTPNPDYRVGKEAYDRLDRLYGSYGGDEFIHSWFGSLFTYQFSHAFVDFRNLWDEDGVNWWDNSVAATLANREYAIDYSSTFKTFGENSWGMTAGDGPTGYSGFYGAAPSGNPNWTHVNDGTITVAGAIGSLPFAPELVSDAVLYFDTLDDLKGTFGFKDGYNLENPDDPWFATDSLGIDKGITVVMIGNYYTEVVWDSFMQSEYVQAGLDELGFTDVNPNATSE